MQLNIVITLVCWVLCLANNATATESCDEADLIQKIAEWANTLPVLVKQDEKRLKNFREFEPITDNPSLLRNEYYRMVSETQQTSWFVHINRKLIGFYIVHCKYFDCTKYSFWQCYISHCNLAAHIAAKHIALILKLYSSKSVAVMCTTNGCDNPSQITVGNVTQQMAVNWL